MFNWKYHNPVEITFGPGAIDRISELASSRRSLLITTPGSVRRCLVDSIKERLGELLVSVYDGVHPNPTFRTVRETHSGVRSVGYDVIIALGGGSVIDTAKAVSAMDAMDDSERFEACLKDEVPFPSSFDPKPIIAIPTTAGTGSEVTMWGTIWDMDEKRKYSVSHRSLYPKRAIIDPKLTLSLPEKETIHGGLDALSHAMESIWNKNNNDISDHYALKAIQIIFDCLPKLRSNLGDINLRTMLAKAGLFAGLAFSNTKTALAHSISYPLTAAYGLPHGLASSLPLVYIMECFGDCCFERIKGIAGPMKCQSDLSSMVESLKGLFKDLDVSLRLSDYGVKELLNIAPKSFINCERFSNFVTKVNEKDILTLVRKMI